MDNNYLQHYGVKGMKWGVRKARRSSDSAEVKQIRKKKVSQMSNAELRKANERIRLEQEYKRLNPNAIKKGIAVAATVAGAMGTVVALQTNGSKIINAGKKAFNKFFEIDMTWR